jgi:hypothetical protein
MYFIPLTLHYKGVFEGLLLRKFHKSEKIVFLE